MIIFEKVQLSKGFLCLDYVYLLLLSKPLDPGTSNLEQFIPETPQYLKTHP